MFERSNLVRLQETFDVEIDWHGFQLHPEIPAGGIALADYFGPRADRMRERVVAFAAGMGVQLNALDHAPSTIAPLAATEYARDRGALELLRDRLMDAYWLEGEDIESPATLARAGADAGLDGEAVASAASDPAYISRVKSAREQAHDGNISAIPTLVMGGFPVVGCQRWEVYEMVAEKRGLTRRS